MTPEQARTPVSLRDRIAAALAVNLPLRLSTSALTDVIMGVLSEQPWTGWRYVGADEESDEELPSLASLVGSLPNARRQIIDAPELDGYRIALRPHDDGTLDDVVVNDVSMFRAEMMSATSMWMCCYLPGDETDPGRRIDFWVQARKQRGKPMRLDFCCTDQPGNVTYEQQTADPP